MSARNSKKKSASDWDYLASESDKGIDFSEIPRLGPDFWRRAALRMPRKKESVTLQLDHDVLSWFRGLGRGYQTRINAVLRSYVKAATKAQS
ncbi:MAG: BrnA antitoxin family protein [Planctomycetes bacterium]|nr:BrnA antitoxin family protein [Planctomycetota bacterium]MBM4085410.1 BrnA antitoxin family protein [Planctomycetota bacterium]